MAKAARKVKRKQQSRSKGQSDAVAEVEQQENTVARPDATAKPSGSSSAATVTKSKPYPPKAVLTEAPTSANSTAAGAAAAAQDAVTAWQLCPLSKVRHSVLHSSCGLSKIAIWWCAMQASCLLAT